MRAGTSSARQDRDNNGGAQRGGGRVVHADLPGDSGGQQLNHANGGTGLPRVEADATMPNRILLQDWGVDGVPIYRARTRPETGVVAVIGVAFLVVGGGDLALTWLPAAFGSAAWKFGTITQTLNGLPVPTLGLALLALCGRMGRRPWLSRTTAIVMLALAVAMGGLGLLYALTLPVALHAQVPSLVMLGLKKAIAKSALQFLTYMVAFAWLGIAGLKWGSTFAAQRW